MKDMTLTEKDEIMKAELMAHENFPGGHKPSAVTDVHRELNRKYPDEWWFRSTIEQTANLIWK